MFRLIENGLSQSMENIYADEREVHAKNSSKENNQSGLFSLKEQIEFSRFISCF